MSDVKLSLSRIQSQHLESPIEADLIGASLDGSRQATGPARQMCIQHLCLQIARTVWSLQKKGWGAGLVGCALLFLVEVHGWRCRKYK